MTSQKIEFSEADIALIQAFLSSSDPSEVEPVSEERLVRYAFGWSTEADEEKVLDALTHSGGLRQELIQVRRSLDAPEAQSNCVRQFLDYAISLSAAALGALEKGAPSSDQSFEAKLVVQHALESRASRLAMLPGQVAWERSAVEDHPAPAIDALIVDTELGAPTSLPIATGPVAQDGRLELELEFGPRFLSEYADQMLGLSFAAGPLLIPLKTWRVQDLPKDGRLTAPIPSSLAGPVPRTAIELSLFSAA